MPAHTTTTQMVATIRALLAAGWRVDSVHTAGVSDIVRTMLHPSGPEIIARTARYDGDTALTLTGLTLDQVAGAITGAGLTPSAEAQEHRHVGGSVGGPGQCSAECACGVTFDGFDTNAEAEALLDGHIAQETGATPAAENATAESDDEEAWYFTFRHDATDRETSDDLAGKFVRIDGTYESARQQAEDRFGAHWIADQMTTFEAYDVVANLSMLPFTPATPKPDHWTNLAQSLREVADNIATLAGTPSRSATANIYLNVGTYLSSEADQNVPVVDAIAAVLDGTAETKYEGRGTDRYGEHRATARRGDLKVHAYCRVPVPPTRRQKMADLEAENAALRAQLAGGAR